MPEYHVPDRDIVPKIEDYWDSRANGYSISSNWYMQHDDGRLTNAISRFVNLNRSMTVLDVGTGPGDTAIKFARAGNRVYAMDLSEKMLEKAEENAENYGVEVTFVQGQAEEPPFSERMFDIIIATSCVWTFRDPLKAYTAWKDLLKPGGYIIVYDGNHYLDLFDEDYKNRITHMDLKHGENSNRHAKDNVDGVDFNIIRELAKDLPMSRFYRPSWDVKVLQELGATEINIKNMDAEMYYTLSRNGYIVVPSKFLICARFSDPDEPASCRPLDPADMEAASRRMSEQDYGYVEVIKALADENRMRILTALGNGRMTVKMLSEMLSVSQPLVSHHISVLKEFHLVASERMGKQVFYGLINETKVLDLIYFCKQTEEQLRDREDIG